MSSKKLKNKTLSEKISESFIPKALADPERDSEDETTAKLADVDEDEVVVNNKLSDFRKRNVKLLSEFGEKYRGKVSSRADFMEDDSGGSEEVSEDEKSSEDDDNALEQYRKELMGSKLNRKQENGTVDSDDSGGEELMDDGTEEDESDENEAELSDEDEDEVDEEEDEVDEEEDEVDEEEDEVDEEEDEVDEEEDEVDEEEDEVDEEEDEVDEEEDEVDEEEDEEEENNKGDEEIESQSEVEEEQDLEVSTELLKQTDKKEEIRKGFAVQSQLKLWEKFLEVRIHSQKMLTKANSLPEPEKLKVLCEEDNDLENLRKETQQTVCSLLDSLLQVKHSLLNQFPDTKDLAKKLRKRSSNAKTDEPPMKCYAATLQENMENFRPYMNSVLLKWNDRTKVLTPGTASKRNKSFSDNFDILKKIDAVLLNKTDLIKKTQVVKGTYTLFGCDPETMEEDSQKNETQTEMSSTEIYDDTDFYHQLLRELIEFKTNTSATPAEMSKQFAELQKLRQKMKKKVDTRASKGRKIRYVVHNKLVNFMAPNPYTSWTEDSKTELYRSLFGS